MSDNLPALTIDAEVEVDDKCIVTNTDITPEIAVTDLQKQEVALTNMAFSFLMASWKGVKTISQVCRLSQATFSAIKERRAILGHSYGHKDQTSNNTVVYTID
jgi:hypothetical protein